MSDKPERYAQAKQVFLGACELPPEQRPGYLERVCGDDEELRAEVERLLAHHVPETVQPPDLPFRIPVSESRTPTPPDASTTAETGHGFVPGTAVADRYRIVSLLGAGGMGLVYRADDLKLGLPVALKFLPQEVSEDPIWLDRLYQEVRIAREVTHPNVCRVYDIGEAKGLHFISMECVDGENLSSLLKRIGRLPHDKALDVGRQICAGVAAAHVRGVLHRDLKPANIMLDARGQVRITDFGLAGLAGTFKKFEIPSGTPAYMAPEQLAGRAVTERSDIYALGLVLYEVFCGQPAFRADNIAEYRRMHEQVSPPSPSEVFEHIDPDVERAILKCLEKNPEDRPESALAVAASLPGGDALAAALALGQTPSPQMVAAATSQSGASLRHGLAYFAAFLALMCGFLAASRGTEVVPLEHLSKSPQVLADKASAALSKLGYAGETADHAYGYVRDSGSLLSNSVALRRTASDADVDLAFHRDAPVFWYRQSPSRMSPQEAGNLTFSNARVTPGDPPLTEPGMATVALDGQGRLLYMEVVPEQNEDAEIKSVLAESALFELAGLQLDTFTPTHPELAHNVPGAKSSAWIGTDASAPMRVEIAWRGSTPVLFAALDTLQGSRSTWHYGTRARHMWVSRIKACLVILLLVVSAPIARINFLRDRSDRKGSLRLAVFVVAIRMIQWALGARHAADFDAELLMLSMAALRALGEAALVWLFYIALEPYVRRFWPRSLVSWVRVLAGRIRDPLVGRDILAGTALGMFWALLVRLDILAVQAVGLEPRAQIRGLEVLTSLLGGRQATALALDTVCSAVYESLLWVLLIVLLQAVLKRSWLTLAVALLLTAPLYLPRGAHPAVSWMTVGVLGMGVAIWAAMRLGLLAMVVGVSVFWLLVRFPITRDTGAWYFDLSLFAVAVTVATGVCGFLLLQDGRGHPTT